MKKYRAQARVLTFGVGEEFDSADTERWAPYVESGYLVIVAEEPAEPVSDDEEALGNPSRSRA